MGEQFLGRLAEQGILGLLLVISIVGLVYMFIELRSERQRRIDDLKEVWQKDLGFREEIKNSLNTLIQLMRGGNQ